MTTSYGNVVGTPLDEIPDISATNYDKTSADLTGKINTNIDQVTEDARRQSAYLQEILKAQAEKPLDTLKAVAEFGRQGVKFKDVAEKFIQAREYISEADAALEKGLDLNEVAEEEDYKNLGAVFTGDLWKDGSPEALDLIVADNESDEGTKNTMRETVNHLLPQILDGGHNWREENGSLSANTKGEYVKIYGQSQELITVSLFYQLQEAGVDVNSRSFKKLWRQKIYPEMLRRKENNMLSFERRFEINADKRRDTKVTNDITDTFEKIQAIKGDTEEDRKNKAALMTNLVNRVKLQFNFQKDTQATNKITDIISTDISNRGGTFFPQDADFFMNDALFSESSSGKVQTFEDLLIGSTPQFKDNIRNKFTTAINSHNVNPDDEFKAKASLFETEVVQPLREKFPTGVVDPTDLAEARVEWERRFGNKHPFPQSILSFNSKQFTGAHLSGASYADRIDKGNPYKEYFDKIDSQVVQLYKDANPDVTGIYNLKDIPELSESFRATLAKEQFAADMDLAKAANPGKSVEELALEVLPDIQTDLKDRSKFVVKPSQAGGVTGVELANYADAYGKDNSILNKPQFFDIYEQAAIDEGHLNLLNGKHPGRYWTELGKYLKMDPTYLLMTRIKAMGGYEDDKISNNKLLFDLNEEQRQMLFRNPSLNKTINLFLNKDTMVPIIEAMKQTKIIDGKEQYVSEDYYTQKNGGRVRVGTNGSRISINGFLKMPGVNNIGIYGFSKENLRDIKNYKVDGKPLIDLDKEFDENMQTQAVVILSKVQLNRKGVISGMKVDINKLDNRRLSSITEEENDLLNGFFLNLNDADIMTNWNTHSDDLNNLFIGDSEQRKITDDKSLDATVGEGTVENFLYDNRNNDILLKNLDKDKEYTKYSELPKKVQNLLIQKLRLRIIKNEEGVKLFEKKPSYGRKKRTNTRT